MFSKPGREKGFLLVMGKEDAGGLRSVTDTAELLLPAAETTTGIPPRTGADRELGVAPPATVVVTTVVFAPGEEVLLVLPVVLVS